MLCELCKKGTLLKNMCWFIELEENLQDKAWGGRNPCISNWGWWQELIHGLREASPADMNHCNHFSLFVPTALKFKRLGQSLMDSH